MIDERQANDLLAQAVARHRGKTTCDCGKPIDRADVAWNNGDTGSGTPYIAVTIECAACGRGIGHWHSWYPWADSFEELAEGTFDDWD